MVYAVFVEKAISERKTLPTGIDALDRFLGGGWPAGGLTALSGKHGAGKTTLVLRTVSKLTRSDRWVALVSRGTTLFPPALHALGIDLSRLLWVHPPEENLCRWALEQLTRSGLFPLVIGSGVRLDERDARRLQITAEGSGAAVVLLNEPQSNSNLWALSLHCEVERASEKTLLLRVRRSRRFLSTLQTEVNPHEIPHSGPLSSELPARRVAS